MLSSMKNALATARSRLPSLDGLLRLGAKRTSPKDGVRSVLAWRSCRRIPSATLGKKAHFCDRHHIAGATAALVSLSSTGYRVSGAHLRWFPPELSPANAGLLCVLTSAIGGIPEDMGTGWRIGGVGMAGDGS